MKVVEEEDIVVEEEDTVEEEKIINYASQLKTPTW